MGIVDIIAEKNNLEIDKPIIDFEKKQFVVFCKKKDISKSLEMVKCL